uniref:Cytochrome P450 n=1 Tax=Panagrellus redivivus TaxID=6233 RepID=A0A7E4VT74_PANRE
MEREFRTYTENKDSPGLMRIWIGPKPIVIFYKPETVRVVLESQVLISKPFEYSKLEDWLGTGLLTSTGSKWHSRRKMLTPAFHFSILANSIVVFNRQADIFLQEMDKHADDGYPFDFYHSVKNAALDIICEAAMGINLGAQRGANVSYCESVKLMSEMVFRRMRSPWLWPEALWYLIGQGHEFDKHLKIVKTMTKGVIAERKFERYRIRTDDSSSASSRSTEQELWDEANLGTKARSKRQAFLDLLLDMQEDSQLTDEDICEEVDTFMFEGHDTVSSSMGFCVYLVAHRPDIQERLFDELRGILEDSDDDVTVEDIGRMRYLEQCIRETLRMFPVVPIIGRVLSEDTQVGDYLLPKGITTLIAPFAVHRDKRFYEDPDTFDPEHFAPERMNHRNPFAYLPFSAGPRNCIGQKFATMEQKVILARFFRRYKVTACLHELENRGLPELILRPSRGFPIRVEKRTE